MKPTTPTHWQVFEGVCVPGPDRQAPWVYEPRPVPGLAPEESRIAAVRALVEHLHPDAGELDAPAVERLYRAHIQQRGTLRIRRVHPCAGCGTPSPPTALLRAQGHRWCVDCFPAVASAS